MENFKGRKCFCALSGSRDGYIYIELPVVNVICNVSEEDHVRGYGLTLAGVKPNESVIRNMLLLEDDEELTIVYSKQFVQLFEVNMNDLVNLNSTDKLYFMYKGSEQE